MNRLKSLKNKYKILKPKVEIQQEVQQQEKSEILKMRPEYESVLAQCKDNVNLFKCFAYKLKNEIVTEKDYYYLISSGYYTGLNVEHSDLTLTEFNALGYVPDAKLRVALLFHKLKQLQNRDSSINEQELDHELNSLEHPFKDLLVAIKNKTLGRESSFAELSDTSEEYRIILKFYKSL
jgi:hypothetical protein